MIISHKNTSTIGDFANTWPLLSQLSKATGPIEITLPPVYKKFIGLKDFLEYQDFVKSVDFEDRVSHIDVQAHAEWGSNGSNPRRSYYSADKLQIPIDRDLILKVNEIDLPKNLSNKIIVIDRTFNKILKNTGWFRSDNFYWLDFSNSFSYNLNICIKAKKVISTFTGLPIILDLFKKEFDLIWFDDIDGKKAHNEHYFSERNSKLFYFKDYDYLNINI